jgi:uncharacterized protein YcgL (UPF0745 family)
MTSMTCWVYRSSYKEGMYLYLSREGAFELLPKPLFQRFGKPELVMQLELHPERKLAREDVLKVMQHLRDPGYHLQLPPEIKPELFLLQ